MSKRSDYESHTEELIIPILSELGLELVDVEYVKEGATFYLRAYIDKEGGVTVDDCEAVSRRMDAVLDEEDYIDGPYVFEVSSPGLTRPLKKEKDFERSIGKDVEIRTYHAINGEKDFRGVLTAYTDEDVTVTDEDGKKLKFLRKEISLIRLAFDF